ncbi:MAG: rRNA (cytidine-2'-O-)-methyltransferase, partial [Paracoccaceae bacterium]
AERTVKGELVVLIDRAPERRADAETIEAALRAALREKSVKDAAADVASTLKLPKRQVYQAALKLEEER